ncbi:unnamed protein product, partial [Adineta steineri]
SCYLLLSFHINIKSIAASLDDLTTLGILASIGGFLFKIIDNYTWLPVMITIIFLILTPIWIIISFGNEYVKNVLIHGCAGGLILDFDAEKHSMVAILLYIAQWLVIFVWRHERDPDNVCIPYLTAIGDLLGTALLTCVFLLLS